MVTEKNSYDINYDSNGGYVYIDVTEAKTKTIKINYYSEAEKKQIAEGDMTVAADATSVNSSKLTAPQGYELVESGDFPSMMATFTLLSARSRLLPPPRPSRSTTTPKLRRSRSLRSI